MTTVLWIIGLWAVGLPCAVVAILWHSRRNMPIETAIVEPDAFGGWHVVFPGDRGQVGHFATAAAAANLARINGYEPFIAGPAR